MLFTKMCLNNCTDKNLFSVRAQERSKKCPKQTVPTIWQHWSAGRKSLRAAICTWVFMFWIVYHVSKEWTTGIMYQMTDLLQKTGSKLVWNIMNEDIKTNGGIMAFKWNCRWFTNWYGWRWKANKELYQPIAKRTKTDKKKVWWWGDVQPKWFPFKNFVFLKDRRKAFPSHEARFEVSQF